MKTPLVAGSGWTLLGGEAHELRHWDVVRASPPVVRACAAGADGMETIAISGLKPEASDGEMLEVVWPDRAEARLHPLRRLIFGDLAVARHAERRVA